MVTTKLQYPFIYIYVYIFKQKSFKADIDKHVRGSSLVAVFLNISNVVCVYLQRVYFFCSTFRTVLYCIGLCCECLQCVSFFCRIVSICSMCVVILMNVFS